MELLNHRVRVDHVFSSFDATLGLQGEQKDINFDCLRSLVSTYKTSCGGFDEYAMTKTDHFVEACASEKKQEELNEALTEACSH